ncbi:MAG TPA: NAD(P)/FAD-dependent oxidoreductase [Thermoflexales bacterium]|nr:NAD(P)/FAD-dependent oxidoreductase [Thermoflexales bacterium]
MTVARYDAAVVGSGPNGLAAAITLAQAGRKTLLIEARDSIGGGARSAALTLPGFTHDVCATVLGLGASSPFFRSLPLAEHGLEWAFPEAPMAHPLDNGNAVIVERSVEATARGIGGPDGVAWRRLIGPIVEDWERLLPDLLGPLPLPPRHPLSLVKFGLRALWPARALAKAVFRGEPARAAFAGIAAHSILPLDAPLSAAFGVTLGANAHASGWPVAKGGSQRFMDALASYFQSLDGEIQSGWEVKTLDEVPAPIVLCDVTPRQLLRIAGERLPAGYRRQLERFRHGPGVFKIDYALSDPIPWTAAEVARAGTVHLGGTLDEIAASEAAANRGRISDRPYVLLVQASRFDPSRAPAGKHTAWAYCHVPHNAEVDMTAAIEAQIERFAPGFRECVLARATKTAPQMELWNANYIGGDINGGVQDALQHYTRPVPRLNPYATPVKGLYFCSSSTPPGGGVHGMCGWHAATRALKG